jgi:hypothetical protein
MTYNNSSDALQQLLLLDQFGGRVTRSSESPTTSSNGLSYYFVEVTCKDGTQYAIHAFGDEAIELHDEVRRRREIVVTV